MLDRVRTSNNPSKEERCLRLQIARFSLVKIKDEDTDAHAFIKFIATKADSSANLRQLRFLLFSHQGVDMSADPNAFGTFWQFPCSSRW